MRQERCAAPASVAEFDADCHAALDWLALNPRVSAGRLGAMGFCIGGHLAFRAALQARARGTVCFYPTGVHDGKLGKDADAGTLSRVGEIQGEVMMVFGSADPHIPEEARAQLSAALTRAGTTFLRRTL